METDVGRVTLTRTATIAAATLVLGLLVAGCSTETTQNNEPASQQTSNAGQLSVGTNGKMYMGVGGGLSMDPTTGKLGIDVGGMTVPMH